MLLDYNKNKKFLFAMFDEYLFASCIFLFNENFLGRPMETSRWGHSASTP